MDLIPVQRNKGIDGFLKVKDSFKPIPVKIQKEEETLEQAIRFLAQACERNGYHKKILIKTNDSEENSLFRFNEPVIDSNMIVIDDINRFIDEKEKYSMI